MQKERILPSLQAKAEKTQKLKYEQQGKHLSYWSEADVQFVSDLTQIEIEEGGPCEAEILMSFFKFYGYEFDRVSYAIDIRSANKPYPARTEVLAQIRAKFCEHPKSQEILG